MEINVTSSMLKDWIGIAGFAISVFLLFIHIKNRRTQLRSYWIAREAYRSSAIQLAFIQSEQLKDFVLLKLVLFNPGSIAAVIGSFSVKRKVRLNFIERALRINSWKEIPDSKWWPTQDASDKTVKYLADESSSLYVEDQRIIYALIPGMIDRDEYQFEIRTNNGWRILETTICATRTSFAHASEDWFYEK
ncbi:hypothetical protein [uncultured Herbaspirillum sp.]|uniref:hypothetical protein n=1 Tax=uncultured Herbaspirillum sp. TaxID=160236 RepID=UPI002589A6A5|nr:hypothetical protein [uncultured Herbaspirillum sp.]